MSNPWSPPKRSSANPPCRLPAKSIQSPYIHRASGLAQIAVSTLLRLDAQTNGNPFTRSAVDTALEIYHSLGIPCNQISFETLLSIYQA